MRHTSSKGFTVVELIIVIFVLGILTALLYRPFIGLYNANTTGLRQTAQFTNVHSALRIIESKIGESVQFLSTNSVADPNGTTWNWTGNAVDNRVFITSNYATTKEEAADTTNIRTLVFKSATCDIPITNNYVYFVKNETLYRRTIATENTTAPTSCGYTNGQKQTCPIDNPATYCKGIDAKIISNVTEFRVDYYSDTGSATPMDPELFDSSKYRTKYSDPNVPMMAKAIDITLSAKSGTKNSDPIYTSKLRITRINGT